MEADATALEALLLAEAAADEAALVMGATAVVAEAAEVTALLTLDDTEAAPDEADA